LWPILGNGHLFSTETQDISPITSPGNSQIRAEEPKPPGSETPFRTASNTSESTPIVADPIDDIAPTPGLTKGKGRAIDPLRWPPAFPQHDHDENQHDPIIYDTPHVDLTMGASYPLFTRSEPFVGKPRLQITTGAPLESRNSDSPGTAFYTPGGSGEGMDKRPFDSAVAIRVVYSRSNSRPRDVGALARRVLNVRQQLYTKYQFPVQRTLVAGADLNTGEVPPRHGLNMSLVRPPRNEPSSPRSISGTTTPGHDSGFWSGSGLASPDMRGDVGTSKEKSIFPRRQGKRAVPEWNGSKDAGHGGRIREGVRDDHSSISASTDYVSVSGDIEENPQDTTSPVSFPGLGANELYKS
jgi:hypothetical protein